MEACKGLCFCRRRRIGSEGQEHTEHKDIEDEDNQPDDSATSAISNSVSRVEGRVTAS